MTAPCVHFVGFRDDRYWSAVKVWGLPEYIHAGWDLRARRELADCDIIVFADLPADAAPRVRSYSDLREDGV